MVPQPTGKPKTATGRSPRRCLPLGRGPWAAGAQQLLHDLESSEAQTYPLKVKSFGGNPKSLDGCKRKRPQENQPGGVLSLLGLGIVPSQSLEAFAIPSAFWGISPRSFRFPTIAMLGGSVARLTPRDPRMATVQQQSQVLCKAFWVEIRGLVLS